MDFTPFPSSQSCFVWQPNLDLDRVITTPSPVQCYVKFFLYVRRRFMYRSADRTVITIGNTYDAPKEACYQFDVDVLKNRNASCQIISSILSYLDVDRVLHERIADSVIRAGLRTANLVSNMGRKILPLYIKIKMEKRFLHDERSVIDRAMRESATEFEGGGYVMVPASKSSVTALIKRVRVGGEDCAEGREAKRRCIRETAESCTICLEEFEVGSDAASMPCSHVFHDDCLQKWLNESHYCPICRFEMPTN